MFKVLQNGLLRYILYTCPKSIVMKLTTCTHGAHKIHSGKTAKDLYLTTCTHGCKNKGVHTAKPFRVYRRGPWPRVQMRPLTACTDEAVTLATLARTIRVYLRPWPRTIRAYLRPQKARAQPTPWPFLRVNLKGQQNAWGMCGGQVSCVPGWVCHEPPNGYIISFLLAFLDPNWTSETGPRPSEDCLGFPYHSPKDPWDGIYLPFAISPEFMWPFFTYIM